MPNLVKMLYVRFFFTRSARGEAGISLINMALLIVITGLFMATAAHLFKVSQAYDRADKTDQALKTAHAAIMRFAALNGGRYPCPAPLTAAPNTPAFGIEENCAAPPVATALNLGVRIGALPARTLNLPDEAMLDGWDNRIVYAVSQGLAQAPPGAVLRPIVNNGAFPLTANANYVLAAPGEDARGAFSIDGVLKQPCNLASLAGENCDNDNTFTATLRSDTLNAGGALYFTARVVYFAN